MVAACERCETPLEEGDLRCAVCALPAPPREAAKPGDKAYAKVLRCPGCGAVVGFSPGVQAPHCGFCNATMAIEQPIDPIETARIRVPFGVDRPTAEEALRGWLGKRGWFAPRALRDEATLDSFVPLAWAAWIVSADARVAWAADSNAGSQRSDWAPHAGEVEMTFENLLIPASRGLTTAECRALAPHYELAGAINIAPDIGGAKADPLAPDATIESFDAQRSSARAQVHHAIERVAATRVEQYIPGRRFRNVRVACMLEGQRTDRVALPAWVLAYRYRGDVYRAVVHGQRPEVVIGKSPIDWGKVARLAGGVLAAVAAVIVLALLLGGCGGDDAMKPKPDARDFTEHCVPDGTTFASLTGRAAVQGVLNVHVDAGGLIETDTTAAIVITLDMVQTGTDVALSAQVCGIDIPSVPLAGQDKPITFQIPDATIASLGTVTGSATLGSADQTCATFETGELTVVLGAKLDPIATAPMPAADDSGAFPACMPMALTLCKDATGTNCACDQEGDGNPGSTVVAHNVPAVDLDEVYASVRTNFKLTGHVFGADKIDGVIDASLEQGILACKLTSGTACAPSDVSSVRNPGTLAGERQQPDNQSTFRAVRIPDTTTCADVIANEVALLPRVGAEDAARVERVEARRAWVRDHGEVARLHAPDDRARHRIRRVHDRVEHATAGVLDVDARRVLCDAHDLAHEARVACGVVRGRGHAGDAVVLADLRRHLGVEHVEALHAGGDVLANPRRVVDLVDVAAERVGLVVQHDAERGRLDDDPLAAVLLEVGDDRAGERAQRRLVGRPRVERRGEPPCAAVLGARADHRAAQQDARPRRAGVRRGARSGPGDRGGDLVVLGRVGEHLAKRARVPGRAAVVVRERAARRLGQARALHRVLGFPAQLGRLRGPAVRPRRDPRAAPRPGGRDCTIERAPGDRSPRENPDDDVVGRAPRGLRTPAVELDRTTTAPARSPSRTRNSLRASGLPRLRARSTRAGVAVSTSSAIAGWRAARRGAARRRTALRCAPP